MSGRRHRHRGWRSSNRSSSTSLLVAASGSAGASPLQFSWARLALWLTGAGCSASTPTWCYRLGSAAEAAWQQRRARLSRRLKQCCASGAMLSHPPIGQPGSYHTHPLPALPSSPYSQTPEHTRSQPPWTPDPPSTVLQVRGHQQHRRHDSRDAAAARGLCALRESTEEFRQGHRAGSW